MSRNRNGVDEDGYNAGMSVGVEGGVQPNLETSVQLMEVVLSVILSHRLALGVAPYLAYWFRGSRPWSPVEIVGEDTRINRKLARVAAGVGLLGAVAGIAILESIR